MEKEKWNREAIVKALGDEELKLAYRASVLRLAKDVLGDFADGVKPTPDAEQLANLEGLMSVLITDEMASYENISEIHASMTLSKDPSVIQGGAA